MVKKGVFRSRELLEEVALWQVLGFLWKGGIPILEAMDVVKNAWPRFSKALGKIVSAIREGTALRLTCESCGSSRREDEDSEHD